MLYYHDIYFVRNLHTVIWPTHSNLKLQITIMVMSNMQPKFQENPHFPCKLIQSQQQFLVKLHNFDLTVDINISGLIIQFLGFQTYQLLFLRNFIFSKQHRL